MKRTAIPLFAAAFAAAASADTLVTPAYAYAENYYEEARSPERAIRGFGLSADGTTHSNVSTDAWMGKQENGAGGTFARWFIVDLGDEVALSSVKIWNFNMASWTKRGIKQMDLFVSTAEAPALKPPAFIGSGATGAPDWTLVKENHILGQASGSSSYVGEAPIELDGVPARWVGIRIDSVFDPYTSGNGGFGGISEIRFFAVDADRVLLDAVRVGSDGSATFAGTVIPITEGASVPVALCYGTEPGSNTIASWQNNVDLGSFPAGAFTNVVTGLPTDTVLYAAFCIPSGDEPQWSETTAFSTGAITVEAPASFYECDTSVAREFVFRRPAACAAEALTVALDIGGTAVSGTDYKALPASIGFGAGETTATLAVTPVNNSATDGARTLVVAVAPGPYATGPASSATVSILDDETDRLTCAWTGAGDGTRWQDPANWSGLAVPRLADAATFLAVAAPTVTIDSAATAYSIKTGSTSKRPFFDIGADLLVANAVTFGDNSGTGAVIDHHAGTFRVTGNIQFGNNAANVIDYDLHGPGAALVASGLYSNKYRSEATNNLSKTTITVRDGARLDINYGALTTEGAGNNKPPSYTYLYVLDGATATFNTLLFAAGGSGHVVVSNATLNATTLNASSGAYNGLLPSVDICDGGVANIGSIAYCQYTASNQRMTQWPGSTVNAKEMKLAGSGQGGTGSATNIVYEMLGGSLVVTNASTIGNNGNAELRLEGGTALFKGDLAIDALRDKTGTVVSTNELGVVETNTVVTLQYAPSLLRIAGDASLSIPNSLLSLNGKSRGGRVAVELEGGRFTASVKNLSTSVATPVRVSLRPRVDATGLGTLAVANNVTLKCPVYVEPVALENALDGTYPVLTWGGTLSGPEEPFVLDDPENGRSIRWSLRLDADAKTLYLRCSRPATLIFLR